MSLILSNDMDSLLHIQVTANYTHTLHLLVAKQYIKRTESK